MAITPLRWVLAISGGSLSNFFGKLCKKIKKGNVTMLSALLEECGCDKERFVGVDRVEWRGAGRGQVRHWLPEVEPVNWCKRCLHQPAPETEVLIVELVLTPRQPSLWLAPFCEVIVSDIANARRGNRLVQQPPPHPLSPSLWCVCVYTLLPEGFFLSSLLFLIWLTVNKNILNSSFPLALCMQWFLPFF